MLPVAWTSTRAGPAMRLVAAFSPPIPVGPRKAPVKTAVDWFVAVEVRFPATSHRLSLQRRTSSSTPPRKLGRTLNWNRPKRAPPAAPTPGMLTLYQNMRMLKLDVERHVPLHGRVVSNDEFMKTIGKGVDLTASR